MNDISAVGSGEYTAEDTLNAIKANHHITEATRVQMLAVFTEAVTKGKIQNADVRSLLLCRASAATMLLTSMAIFGYLTRHRTGNTVTYTPVYTSTSTHTE